MLPSSGSMCLFHSFKLIVKVPVCAIRKRIKSIQINSAIKNETVSFAKKYVKLEVIDVSGIDQIEKDKRCMFSVICRTLVFKN